MFRNEHKTVVYNTLNSAYLVCPNDAVVEQILEQWENAGNGYGAVLAEKDLENGVVKDFVNTVRESLQVTVWNMIRNGLSLICSNPTCF